MIRFLQSGNKFTKYFLGGILVVICGSMCLYLIPGFMTGASINQNGVVASVAGQDITTEQVQNMTNLMVQQQRQRGQQIPDFYLGIMRQQAVQQLLQSAEIRYEADRLGLQVSDEELQNHLHTGQFGEMFYPKGNFVGYEKYQEMVQNFGVSTDEFERQLRLELLWNKVVAAVTAGVSVAPSEIEKAYKDQGTKVKFDYAVLKIEDIEKDIKPTDAELKSFYDTNKARYQNAIQEKRQIRYFLISEKNVESKVTVTPADLDQYYRAHQDQYRVPDRVKARHILIELPKPGPDGKVDQKAVDAARAKAEDVLKQVKAGGDFPELANKYSDDPGNIKGPDGKGTKGGELGWFIKGQMVPEFEKAAFGQNKGQISDLVQTSFGFHIIQTEDKELARVKPLSEVKDSIESTLKQQKVATVLDQMANTAQADAKTEGMDKAAAKYGTQAIETNPVGRADSLPGIGPSNELMGAVFTLDQKSGIQSLRIPQGDVVFQVEKIVPPRTPDFEEIKDRVAGDFKSERANTLLTQKTTELSDRAKSEHDLHKAAKELGATVKTSDLVGRGGQVPDIGSMNGPSNVAFTMKPGDISGPLNTGRMGSVLQVVDHQEPPMTGDEFAKAKDNLRDQLIGQKRQEAFQLFMSNLADRLQKDGKVKINKDALSTSIPGRS